MSFIPCSQDLFFKSTKPNDPRLGEKVQPSLELSPATSPSYVIAGFPDDEGIKINGGRIGAASAPDTIRKSLYKMTPPPWYTKEFSLWDGGNLQLSSSLEERHQIVSQKAQQAMTQGHTWIGLGGGHDYAYADGSGFLKYCSKSKHKPLIINFDAHLDVRDTTQGLSSGTPFYRLLTEFPDMFDFIEIGIQPQCNSAAHYQWVKSKNATVISYDDFLIAPFVSTTLERIAEQIVHKRPTYLSIDIDAFSSAYAPGCSQSWSTGIEPQSFFTLMNILTQRLDIRALGIYEVSPPLDTDDRTSKLAAQIVHRFLFGSH